MFLTNLEKNYICVCAKCPIDTPFSHIWRVLLLCYSFAARGVDRAIRTLSDHFFSDSDSPVASRMAVNLGLPVSLWNPRDMRNQAHGVFQISKPRLRSNPRLARSAASPTRAPTARTLAAASRGRGRAGEAHQTEGNPHPNATRRRVRE
jgi:hypothetical protein